MKYEQEIQQAVRCLKALSHPTRLGILYLLQDGEKTVCDLQHALGGTQSNMSQHLGIMRERDVLSTRKESNLVYYGIKNQDVFELLDVFQRVFCKHQTQPFEDEDIQTLPTDVP